jgi:hypothetical protein
MATSDYITKNADDRRNPSEVVFRVSQVRIGAATFTPAIRRPNLSNARDEIFRT